MTMTVPAIRTELQDGDTEAIVALHVELYAKEHAMAPAFGAGVRKSIEHALDGGWPERGGVWLLARDGGLGGCIGLTDEGAGIGRLRWVLLHPALRGQGLGRRLITLAVEESRALGLARLELDTFAALEVAAAVYRSLGFRLVSSERTTMWGPEIDFQRYELAL